MSSPFEFRPIEPREKLVEGAHPFAGDAVDLTEPSENPYEAGVTSNPYKIQYETTHKQVGGWVLGWGVVALLCGLAAGTGLLFLDTSIARPRVWQTVVVFSLACLPTGSYALLRGSVDLSAVRMGAVDSSGSMVTLSGVIAGGVGLLAGAITSLIWVTRLMNVSVFE